MRRLAQLVVLAIHVTGVALALSTLSSAWDLKLLLKLFIGRMLVRFLGDLAGGVAVVLFWALLAAVALTALLAIVEVRKTLRRCMQRQPESDLALRLRVLLYVALGCVSLGVFVLSAPEGHSGPFRVKFPILADLLATLSYGTYLLWSARLPGRKRDREPGRKLRRLDLLCMNAALALLLAELGLRTVAAFVPIPILITEQSSPQIRRDSERRAPGELRFGFPMNQGGHYDTEFVPRSARSTPLVASIGDSFSYGIVPHAYHFTTVAEREHSGVAIYNMGFPGTDPRDYLHLLEHTALPLDPDLVVIQLFLGNDIALSTPHQEATRWHDADRYAVGILWHRLKILRRAERVDWAGATGQPRQSAEELKDRYPWLVDPSLETPSLSREVYLEIAARNAGAICGGPRGFYLPFFQALDNLVRAAEGVPLAFVLIPDEFQVEDWLWDEIQGKAGRPLDRDLPQRRTIEWLEDRGIAFLNLLPILRAVEPFEDGRRHVFHLQDTHFNARGNEIAGRALARFIEPLLSDRSALGVREPLPFQLDLGIDTNRRWLRSGWQSPESGFVWSDGLMSVLHAPIGDETDIEMVLDCLPFADPNQPEQRILVSINDRDIAEISLLPGRSRHTVTLPKQLLRRHRNLVGFRYAYTAEPRNILPDSEDTRELAVAWYSVRFTALEDEEGHAIAP